MPIEDGSLMSGQCNPNDGIADAKADGPNDDGNMMPCPVAHMMLAKMKMPKLMSDALMIMLLSMTMSYLMLLTKLTRCILMIDVQSYLTLLWMFPSLLIDVVIDDAAR